MNKIQKIIIFASIAVAGTMLVGAAIYMQQQKQISKVPQPVVQRTVMLTELRAADGKDGRDCLVAVDGTVYKIEDFSLWQDGQHKSSKGQAYCGADLSNSISKSPHGRQKLDVLIKIGPLGS